MCGVDVKWPRFEWDWLTSVQLQVGGQEWQETTTERFPIEGAIQATTTPYSSILQTDTEYRNGDWCHVNTLSWLSNKRNLGAASLW
jgi:hypothetical protein